MDWTDLRTDYTNAQWSGLKRYKMIENSDGTVSFQDVTQYRDKDNSFFGANEANQMNAAMNLLAQNINSTSGDAETSGNNAAASQRSADAAALSERNAATSEANTDTSEKNAALSEANAKTYAANASKSQAAAAASESNAATSKSDAAASEAAARASAVLAASWAVGGTKTRDGEDTDNAKYYAQKAAVSEESAAASKAIAEEKATAVAESIVLLTDAKEAITSLKAQTDSMAWQLDASDGGLNLIIYDDWEVTT